MNGAGWFRAKSGRVLEDALRAGVVNELVAADEAFFHRDLAPGAEAIGKCCQGYVRGCRHVRHSLRPLRTLSTDRVDSEPGGVKKTFSTLPDEKYFVI